MARREPHRVAGLDEQRAERAALTSGADHADLQRRAGRLRHGRVRLSREYDDGQATSSNAHDIPANAIHEGFTCHGLLLWSGMCTRATFEEQANVPETWRENRQRNPPGGPNGIRPRVYSPPRARCSELPTSKPLTEQCRSEDLKFLSSLSCIGRRQGSLRRENPKLEYRNPKQIRDSKKAMFRIFPLSTLRFVSDFVLRISNFPAITASHRPAAGFAAQGKSETRIPKPETNSKVEKSNVSNFPSFDIEIYFGFRASDFEFSSHHRFASAGGRAPWREAIRVR
jgi:hypothetical protein